jgi:hypothetical protein
MSDIDYLQLWNGKRGEHEHVKCIGIRGALDDAGAPNQLGIYDDDIVLYIGDEVTVWKASTDPGRYYIQHPENPDGCAQLEEGIHMFKVGVHQNKYLAFVQAESFHVNRLNSKGNVVSVEFGDFGIHLHSGGPGIYVGIFSAGCQVIACEEGYFGKTWHAFFDPAVAAMNNAQQSLMPYMLIDENDVIE